MTIDDRKRHALYERFDEVLGDEHADTMMALLPPVGWADVATKHDLAALEERIDLRIDSLEWRMQAGFAELRAEFHIALRQQLWAILGVLVVALVLSEVAGRIA